MSPRRGVWFWAVALGIVVVLATGGGLLLSSSPTTSTAVGAPAPVATSVVAPRVTEPEATAPVIPPLLPADPVAVAASPQTPPDGSTGPPSTEPVGLPTDTTPPDHAVPPSTTSAAPPEFADVPIHQPHVRVTLDDADPAEARRAVTALRGVVHVAEVRIADRTLGGVAATVAEVDPKDFRSLTPYATANHRALWERLADGDVALTHEFGIDHDVPLGATLATDLQTGRGDPILLRVGAFATNGTPPLADAIVVEGRLPDTGSAELLVALEPEASPSATVTAVEQLGLAAQEIADPRLPRSEAVIPVGGITPDNVWDHLALCESSGDWQINTGNGYYGGIQFLPESWALVGGQGLPHEHSREEQIYRGTLLWQLQGWEAWPQCARRLGLIIDRPGQPLPSSSATPVRQ